MGNTPRGRARAMASRKRLFYTIVTNFQAVELTERPSKEAAARQFKVDPKRTREWCQQKIDSLVEINKRRGVLVSEETRRSWTKSHRCPDRFIDVMTF